MESIIENQKDVATAESRFTVKDYVDIVEKQKHQFDTFFCLKLWRPKPNLHPEATKLIADCLLESPQMKDVIHQVSYHNISFIITTD